MNSELEQVKEKSTGNIDSVVNNLLKTNPMEQQKENTPVNISDNISKGYKIIEDIQTNKVDKFQGMKDFLLNLDVITKNVDKSEYQDNIIEDLKKIIEESKKDVTELIDKAPSTQVISSSLDTILMRIEGALDNKKNPKKESLHFEKIDKLYLKMYNAMQKDEKKKVAFYRGRLIRELKKEKKVISQMYEEVKSLEEINRMLKNEASLDQIKEVLLREENKEYGSVLNNYLDNENNFRMAFQKLYDDKEVRRIILYNDALKEELKNQRVYYKKRYDEEFLGKKGDVLTTLKSFPTAMALSAKSIANSINELREAKTNKMKIQKAINTLKDVGKFAVTPVIATGKFLMSNWYTLLKLYKGPYQEVKEELKNRNQQDSPATEENNNQNNSTELEKQGPPTAEEYQQQNNEKQGPPTAEEYQQQSNEQQGPPAPAEQTPQKSEDPAKTEDSKLDPALEKYIEEHPELKKKVDPFEGQSLDKAGDNIKRIQIAENGEVYVLDDEGNVDPQATYEATGKYPYTIEMPDIPMPYMIM